MFSLYFSIFFFFNDTATTEIYTLSLHDALPISRRFHYLDQIAIEKFSLNAVHAKGANLALEVEGPQGMNQSGAGRDFLRWRAAIFEVKHHLVGFAGRGFGHLFRRAGRRCQFTATNGNVLKPGHDFFLKVRGRNYIREAYNKTDMARGWESKSVESQMDEARSEEHTSELQ